MTGMNEMQNSKQEQEPTESSETVFNSDSSEKLIKLAKLLKDKGVITEPSIV